LYGVQYKDVEMSLEDFMLFVETARLWEISPCWMNQFATEHFDELCALDWKFIYTYFSKVFDINSYLEEHLDILEEDIIDHEAFEYFEIANQVKILEKFNRKKEILRFLILKKGDAARRILKLYVKDNIDTFGGDIIDGKAFEHFPIKYQMILLDKYKRQNEILKFLVDKNENSVEKFLNSYIEEYCKLTNYQRSCWLKCDQTVRVNCQIVNDINHSFMVIKSLFPFSADYYDYFVTTFDVDENAHQDPDGYLFSFILNNDTNLKLKDKLIFATVPPTIATVEEILSNDQPLLAHIQYEVRLDFDINTIKKATDIYHVINI
jgi:hypothetical protein